MDHPALHHYKSSQFNLKTRPPDLLVIILLTIKGCLYHKDRILCLFNPGVKSWVLLLALLFSRSEIVDSSESYLTVPAFQVNHMTPITVPFAVLLRMMLSIFQIIFSKIKQISAHHK
jgi:hypothetical protein